MNHWRVSLVLIAILFVLSGTAALALDPLVVTASANVTGADCGLTVEFDGTATGGTTSYIFAWDFGDGDTSGAEDPSHTYAAYDSYDVELTVTDSSDPVMEASASLNFTLTNPVEAMADADPQNAVLDGNTGTAEIEFTGDVSGGVSPYDFEWDFDDGSPVSTDQNPTHEYDAVGVYEVSFTATDDNGCEDTDMVTVVISSEEAESIVGDMLGKFFHVTNDDLNALRDDHWGWGEIAFAYWLSWLSGEDVDNIIALREDMGWGKIFQEFLSSGLAGFNLGAVMSGRVESLAEECGLTMEELQAFIQDTGASLPDLWHACRLAAETDGEVSFEDILQMHEDGMSWGEIGRALSIAADCDLTLEELQALVEEFGASFSDAAHACRLADEENTIEEILGMHAGGMSWGEIQKGLSGDEAGILGQGNKEHGKGGNPHQD